MTTKLKKESINLLKLKSILLTIIWMFTIVHLCSQVRIVTTDDFRDAVKESEKENKLILAIYTEDKELEEDYFEYLEWHDSLVDLINKDYIVCTQRSAFNAVELLYGEMGVLTYMELEEDQEDLYTFLKKVSDNRSEVNSFIQAEKNRNNNGRFANVMEMYSYLSIAMNIFEISKEIIIEEYISSIPLKERGDSQNLELLIFHTQSINFGYTHLRKLIRSDKIEDALVKKRAGEKVKKILEDTYLAVLEVNDEESLWLMFRELNWYLVHYSDQGWDNKYKYALSKYLLSRKKKDNKEELLEEATLFVNNWLMNQISSNAPFMTAEDIAYDLASIADLMIDRKISKTQLPSLLPWVEEAARIYPGYQIKKVHARLLDKLKMKKEARIEKEKVKWYKSKLSKDLIKLGERKFEDALDPEMILIYFLDSYFYPEMYVMP